MRKIKLQKVLYILALLIIPALYIVTGFLFQSERGGYFLFSVDPEYCYLFNGLNIAQGTMKVWHVDHPGTPLQFFSAIIIRVVHFFHNKEPLTQDVLRNSQLYVRSIVIGMFSVTSIAIFILGQTVLRISKSLMNGIFLQIIPFSTYLTLSLILRINPEHMCILCVVLLMIVLVNYLHYGKESKKIFDKYIIWFAIVSGFTIAVKITFLPLIFVPLFLFPGILKKIHYAVFSSISFVIFILPVLYYRFDYFHEWIRKLLVHSGKYGEGASTVIDKNSYITALKQTFSFEPFFTVVFILIILGCIIYPLPYIQKHFKNSKYYRVLLGVALSMILQIMLIAKQFTFHYLTPALLLTIIGAYVLIIIYLKNLNALKKNILFAVLTVYVLFSDYSKVSQYHMVNFRHKETYYKTYNFIQQHPTTKALVIVPNYYGCPYQEYANYFGLFWGGDVMKNNYIPALYKVFPNTYIYNGWDELFHDWDNNSYSYLDVLKAQGSIRLFSGDSTIESNVLSHVMKNFVRINDTRINKIFSNELTSENIYEISYVPDTLAEMLSIECNADSLSSDKVNFAGTENQYFGNGNTQSTDHSYSGNYSSKLTKEYPFGMTYIIGEAKKGDHYLVKVKRYKNNSKASLVIAGRSSTDLYVDQKTASQEENGWEELILDFVVPENMHNKELRIYTVNNTDTPAYFDDLRISLLKKDIK